MKHGKLNCPCCNHALYYDPLSDFTQGVVIKCCACGWAQEIPAERVKISNEDEIGIIPIVLHEPFGTASRFHGIKKKDVKYIEKMRKIL